LVGKVLKMVLTREQRIFIIINYLPEDSFGEVQRKFATQYGFKPDIKTIKRTKLKFTETGSINHKKGAGRPKSIRTQVGETIVMNTFNATPRLSLRRAAVQLQVSKTSISRILKAHNMKPYKMNKVHALLERDPPQRYTIK
jgi:hypothetical protein